LCRGGNQRLADAVEFRQGELRMGWFLQAGWNWRLDGLFGIVIPVTAYREVREIEGPQVAVKNLRPKRNESIEQFPKVPQLVEIARFMKGSDFQHAAAAPFVLAEPK